MTEGSKLGEGANSPLTKKLQIATAVWVIIALALGYTADAAEGCANGFACLAANEWGDFLAGAFAPVAFLWLAGAVYIQSQELSAQRAELKLTREEMRQQRGVMAQQAEEAKNQAEFIGTQTRILERQEKSAQRADEIRRFDQLLNDLSDLISLRFSEQAIVSGFSSSDQSRRFAIYKGRSEWDRERHIHKFSELLSRGPSNMGLEPPYRANGTLLGLLEHAVALANDAVTLSESLGDTQRVAVEKLDLRSLRDNLSGYIDATRSSRTGGEAERAANPA